VVGCIIVVLAIHTAQVLSHRMNKQDMHKVGQGYAGGFTTVTLSREQQDFINRVNVCGANRDMLELLLADKTDSYMQWRAGGNSVLTSLYKIKAL